MKARTQALVHPLLDFWLVGGLSLVFLAAAFLTTELWGDGLMPHVPWWAYYAAFIVNYPHFSYSYQLFYGGIWRARTNPEMPWLMRGRLYIAGLVAPLVLVAYLAWSGLFHDMAMLGHVIAAMFFFLGWHYVKQGYGVLITLSVYKKIFYRTWEKRLLYGNLYLVWIYTWVGHNRFGGFGDYYHAPFPVFRFPYIVQQSLGWGLAITSVLVVLVALKAWLWDRRGFSLSGWTAYGCASYLWIWLVWIHPAFFYFVPLFHSLQYLAFVYRYKAAEWSEQQSNQAMEGKHWWPLAGFALLGVALGGGFMDVIPKYLDQSLAGTGLMVHGHYFIISFLLFINIHHYFIDHAMWRRDNPEVQRFIFRQPVVRTAESAGDASGHKA